MACFWYYILCKCISLNKKKRLVSILSLVLLFVVRTVIYVELIKYIDALKASDLIIGDYKKGSNKKNQCYVTTTVVSCWKSYR